MAEDEAEEGEAPQDEEPMAQEGPEELTTGLKLPLGAQAVEEVWALGEDHEAQAALLLAKLDEVGALGEDTADGFRQDIIRDFHLHNMVHCKTISLTARQTAVFHAVMRQVIDTVRKKSTPAGLPGDNYTSLDAFGDFQRLVLDHAVDRPPDQLGIFAGSEARLLTDYASLTFFKHYLLYQYVLSFPREIETLRVEATIEAPLGIPALQEARLIPEPKRKSSSKTPAEDEAAPQEGDGEEAGGEAADGEAGGDPAAAQEEGEPAAAAEDPAEDRQVSGSAAGEEVNPEVEALIDAQVAEAEMKLDARLMEREKAFMQKLATMRGQGGA